MDLYRTSSQYKRHRVSRVGSLYNGINGNNIHLSLPTKLFFEQLHSRRLRNIKLRSRPWKFRRHQLILPGDNNVKPKVKKSFSESDLKIFDTEEANAVVLDADAQAKAAHPNLAAVEMVARRKKFSLFEENELQTDVRFFSELVKPIQYRWKVQNERQNGRVLSPSKHGYHPRSKSPTFLRLIEATEKLQVIVENDSGMGSIERSEEEDESELQSCNSYTFNKYTDPYPSRLARSEQINTSASNVPTPQLEIKPQQIAPMKMESRPEVKSIKEDTKVTEKNTDEKTKEEEPERIESPSLPPSRVPRNTEFKVDFRKSDSHSELHLFLPYIQESSRGTTPDHTLNKNEPLLSLPVIQENTIRTGKGKQTKKNAKMTNNDVKKRKKKVMPRVDSGDNDKEVGDHLNDVRTLISMEREKEKHMSTSVCMFKDCQYHSKVQPVK